MRFLLHGRAPGARQRAASVLPGATSRPGRIMLEPS